jgi:8-oxo-dGTP pyrophosphatase MutT (NUDIX family)
MKTKYRDFLNEVLYNTNTGLWWGKRGAGVLLYCDKTKRFLISYRSEYVLEPHTWGIWGGKIDEDENPREAVMREIEEETGYMGNVDLIDSYVFKDKNFKYYNFIGIVENEFKPILDRETENYKWVTFDELIKIKPKHFGLAALIENNLNQLKSL